jgi:hypothetical protein
LVNITYFPRGKECDYTTSLNEPFGTYPFLGIPNRGWPRIFLPNAAANMKIRIQLANSNNPSVPSNHLEALIGTRDSANKDL